MRGPSRPRHATLLVALGLAAVSACDRYPPDLPLDAEFTHCTTDDECTVVELGCSKSCFGGLAVSVREDAWERVVDWHAERNRHCGDRTMGLCVPPWEATCAEGTCGKQPVDTGIAR